MRVEATSRDTVPATSPVPPRALPRLGAVVTRTATSLATAVVIPGVLLSATLVLLNLTAALIVSLSWMVGVMSWRWATGRAVSGLLVLTLSLLTIKTGFTLATGNTFVYFLQPVFTDAAVAVIFLGSLWTGLPVVARLASDFYPVDTEIADRPRVRRLFRQLTALWGVVILLKGGLTLWLLVSLSIVPFVIVKSSAVIALTTAAAAATVVLSVTVGRHEGLLDH